MPYKPNKRQRELCEPGYCTTCGVYSPAGRNTAGECTACHNAGYHKYRADRKASGEARKAAAVSWWAERGVQVGDRLVWVSRSWLPGLVPDQKTYGIAQAGYNGPYVHAPGRPEQFNAEGWRRVEENRE
jgi:hypothetical protein